MLIQEIRRIWVWLLCLCLQGSDQLLYSLKRLAKWLEMLLRKGCSQSLLKLAHLITRLHCIFIWTREMS